jgi:hypothetical protein
VKTIRTAFFGLAVLAASFAAHADDSTAVVRIDSIFYNGVTNEFLATATTKLGVAGCPDASSVSFSAVPQGAQRTMMIDLITQAKLFGRTVSFQGNCAPNPQFFVVTRVSVR